MAITIEIGRARRRLARTTRYDIDLTKHLLRLLRKPPGRFDRRNAHLRIPRRKSVATCYFTKDMLLAVGDRYEPENRCQQLADAKYR